MNLRLKSAIILLFIMMLVLSLVGCMTTTYDDSDNIIEAETVKSMISNQNVIVVDARTKEEYDKGHVDGAISLTAQELTISNPVPGIMAPKETVEDVLSQKGISKDSKVYVYDNSGGVYSSRVWFVLKAYGHEHVKVINGGQAALEKAKLKMSLKVPDLAKTTYSASDVDEALLVDKEYIAKVIENEDDNVCIIDVRSAMEYAEGKIPTAILYPHTNNLYKDGTFKSAKNTYLSYKDLGVKKDNEVILYCKSSFRATQTALVMLEAGYENVRVYDGAWLEWSEGDMVVEKEEETVVTTQDAS